MTSSKLSGDSKQVIDDMKLKLFSTTFLQFLKDVGLQKCKNFSLTIILKNLSATRNLIFFIFSIKLIFVIIKTKGLVDHLRH